MIAIVDYGLGNLGSIHNMLKKIEVPSIITNQYQEINKASKLILPGVGAFDVGMQKIHEANLIEALNENVLVKQKPVLGICLGMQLLAKTSEEGVGSGLGWVNANVVKFKFEHKGLKIPHMGWNEVYEKKKTILSNNLDLHTRFYFVHSYHVKCEDENDIALESNYGFRFTAAVHSGNIMGVQFHPEKSHKFGMRLLKNFSQL